MEIQLSGSIVRRFYFFLFALSGFSGLIYESIWTHYLKLFLGHAAYAQILVLIIFMGGMASGAWLAGRYGLRIRNLLLSYALVEGLIGVLAIIFHPLFINVTHFAHFQVAPFLESAFLVSLFKWTIGALIILPQSILLGLTFPFMSAGLLRSFPQMPGHSLAVLYFTNSLGAAIGVLVSGFVLLEAVGLPGTILTAGLLNILIATIVWLLCHTDIPHPPLVVTGNHARPFLVLFLWCAGLTGASSFLYEIAWIRMLSLVLGSSTHAFELMLSAFILGLALGGYWIRKSLDNLPNPLTTLGFIQILMGLLALATLLSYGQTFNLMSYLLTALTKSEPGYLLFNLFSHGLAMLVMLPATICAGMTLPILTHYLITRGAGEGAIGNIYAANTLGAIVGVIIGVQLIMPTLGVKNLITIGGGIDLFLGLFLLWYAGQRWQWLTVATSTTLLTTVVGVTLDPIKMSSGVFRYGSIDTGKEVLFHRDGKTASIDLVRRNSGLLTISTNGKPDASIGETKGASADELTMVLTAALPYAIRPQIKTAANIGLGSGLTSQILLTIPTITSVDTIEIEPAMLEGAKGFGKRVAKVFTDPRSHLHIEDAKTYFTTHRKIYDLIISEPSNPWVSGVAGLFSTEFYHLIQSYLSEAGLFVQWFNLYEIDIKLVASVLKAISANFADYAIYFPVEGDIIIIASSQTLTEPHAKILAIPELAKELAYIGVVNVADLLLRYLGSKRTLGPLFNSYEIPINSDFFPVLDLGAVRTRYLKKKADELYQFRVTPLAIIDTLEGKPSEPLLISENPEFNIGQQALQAKSIFKYFQALNQGKSPPVLNLKDDIIVIVHQVLSLQSCELLEKGWLPYLKKLAIATLPYLSPAEMATIWTTLETTPCFSHLPTQVRLWVNLYQAVGQRNFAQMLQITLALLPPQGPIRASPDHSYLLMVAMLAQLALQHPEAARELWQRYVPPEESLAIQLRLLKTLAGSTNESIP